MIRVGVVGNRGYESLDEILASLQLLAPLIGLDLVPEAGLLGDIDGDEVLSDITPIDALLTLGGDGTLLRGARLLQGREVPVVGGKLGCLGFLTACGPDDIEEALRRFAAGDYQADLRMALEAFPLSSKDLRIWYALNDVVIHKGGKARVMRLAVSVDGEEIASYAADGIVIATPTGSTAYSLSAGGPVVVPTHESIVLTPISAHTLAVRPIILPPESVIEVRVDDDDRDCLVTVDGQIGTTLGESETLRVQRAGRTVLLVRFPEFTFFSRMRRKLGWGLGSEPDVDLTR